MKKSLIVGIVVAVLIGGGAVAYFAMKDDDGGNDDTTNTSQSQDNNGNPTFNPAATDNRDFVATINSGTEGSDSSFEYDVDSESFRYKASASGQSIETIITPDAYFTMANGEWIKYPTATGSGVDPESYQYSTAELSAYEGTSSYVGQESCSAGTCDVWRTSSAGAESALFIETGTGYIVKVETTVDDKTSSIEYDYKDVTINPPTDFQELPSFD